MAPLKQTSKFAEPQPVDPQPRTADAPFNNQENDADVILRTSDKVDFYAHRLILSYASPFFKQLFRSPQAPGAAGPPLNGITEVPEDSRTLNFILRSCYPLSSPSLADFKLAEARRVLEAAFNYEIDAVLRTAGFSLEAYVEEDPLGMFIIGWRADREDVCRAAATRLLRKPLQSFQSEELRNISGYHFNKLVQWHSICGVVASGTVFTAVWFRSSEVLTNHKACGHCFMNHTLSPGWYAPLRLWEYLDRARTVLAACPSSVAVTSNDVLGSKDQWDIKCKNAFCSMKNVDYVKAGRELNEMLGQEVDRVVAEVPIPKFCD